MADVTISDLSPIIPSTGLVLPVSNGSSTGKVTLSQVCGVMTSAQITTALGYTPYNSTNPAGYISSIPAGGIVQVKQTVVSNTVQVTPTQTPFQGAITGLAASIIPRNSSSKILITGHIHYSTPSNCGTYGMFVKRTIQGSAAVSIGLGDADPSKPNQSRASGGLGFPGDNNQTHTFTYNFLDSPATSLNTTYQFFIQSNACGSFWLNRSQNDNNDASNFRGISTVTLMEIAG